MQKFLDFFPADIHIEFHAPKKRTNKKLVFK